MHRIDTDGHLANAFTDGDPGIGQEATVVDDDFMNAVQEELVNVILTRAGVTLVKNTNTQLGSALDLLFDNQGLEPGGRLTLSTGVPVTTAEVGGATTVRYTPHKHDRIKLYDGTRWKWYTFAELSQATTDATKSPAAVAVNSNYDMFVWDDGGTVRCTRGPAWTSDTGRGTGAATTELELFEGRRVNKIAITNGPAARRGLYVGTVRTDGSSQVNDTLAHRHVWNMYHRVARAMRVVETTDSWAYTSATIRQARGTTLNQLDIVRGLDEDAVSAAVNALASSSVGACNVFTGVGLDSTTAFAAGFITTSCVVPNNSVAGMSGGAWTGLPGLGRHLLTWLESGAGGVTIYGDGGTPLLLQGGIHATVMA